SVVTTRLLSGVEDELSPCHAQLHAEASAFARFADDVDGPPHGLYQPPGDIETETRALVATALARVGLAEGVERTGQERWVDARAVVGDPQFDDRWARLGSDRHQAARRRGLGGVVDQVGQNLLEPVVVAQ